MDQENSEKDIDEDCELFGDQITGIMDFYGYPLEEQSPDDKEAEEADQYTEKEAKITSSFLKEFDAQVKAIAPAHIKADEMKLYVSYRFENKNICAAWVKNHGLEIELYINIKEIQTPNSGAFDITYRKRGKKESCIKIRNNEQLEKAISIIKEIVRRF